MSEDKQKRANLLFELATRLQDNPGMSFDDDADETGSQSIDGVRLSAAELEELKRIQNALKFLEEPGSGDGFTSVSVDVQAEVDSVKANSDGTLPNDQSANSEIEPENRIGRFEIIKLVGRGGFSDVYKAFDPTLNREIALKVLKNSTSLNDDTVVRFQREAQAAGILNHPNIVPVFEQGVFNNQMFIVSELCESETLKSWFEHQQHITTSALAASIVKTLAGAVEHAHQRGVIHRDLKPANIMLGSSVTPEFADAASLANGLRITDFGLAKHAGKTDLMETTEGAVVGTPAYMSPEQASGSSHVDNRSDIYSLGVILYELLTGKVPILKSTHLDTLIAINRNEFKSPRQIDSSIPLDLDSICLKCLQKNPTDRYASAEALSLDLDRWLNGQVVTARPTTVMERLSKWCKRNPVAACSIALISMALMIAGWQWRNSDINLRHANSQSRVAESEKNRAKSQSARAEKYLQSMTGFVDNFLDEISTLEDLSLVTDSQRSQLNEVLVMQRALIDNDQSRRSVRFNTLKTYSRMSGIQKALGHFEQSMATAAEARKWLGEPKELQSFVDDLDGDFIHLVLDLGLNECRAMQLSDESEAAIDAAVWCEDVYQEFSHLLDDARRLRFAVTLPMFRGLSLATDGQLQEATKAYVQAEIASEELLLFDNPPELDSVLPISSNLINLGQQSKLSGNFDSAIAYFRKAVAIIEACNDQENVRLRRNLANAKSSMIAILIRNGKPNEATTTSEEALQLMRRLVEEFPSSKDMQNQMASGLLNYGIMLSRQGASDDAFVTLDEIAAMKDQGLDETLRGRGILVDTLNEKFALLLKLKKYKKAEIAATEAVADAEDYFKDAPNYANGVQSTALAWTNLMKIVTMIGKREKAVELIPKGCEALEKMEQNSLGSAGKKWARRNRSFYLGLKSKHLASLGRIGEAVASIDQIIELEPLNKSQPRTSYIEATEALSIVLNLWNHDHDASLSMSREKSHDQAIAWLELAISKSGFRDRKRLLTHRNFRSLREHPRFEEVVALIPESIENR